MATYDVAHIYEQGQNLIIVFVTRDFNDNEYDALQVCAASAGLTGTLILVWQQGISFGFRSPHLWHAFLHSTTWNALVARINKTLPCG